MPANTIVYLRDITPYGEQFAVQQAVALRPSQLLAGNAPKCAVPLPIRSLNPKHRIVRSLDSRAAGILNKSRRSPLGSSAIGSAKLAQQVRRTSAVYTMFGPNAIDVEGALRASRSQALFVFHAAGSDVTAAASRGALHRSPDAGIEPSRPRTMRV